MRRFMIILMAGVVALGVAGPVSAGANVSNTSGSGQTIYGAWEGDGLSGYLYLGKEAGYGAFGEIVQDTGAWVVCEGPAPEKGDVVAEDTTPGDEYYGFVGTRTWGTAEDVTIDISRKFDTGHATGSVELYTSTVDDCNGIYGDPVEAVGSFDITLSGTGPISTFRGSSHYKIPDQFSGHDNYRAKERAATGSVVAGGSIDTTFEGSMSQVTWSAHSKG